MQFYTEYHTSIITVPLTSPTSTGVQGPTSAHGAISTDDSLSPSLPGVPSSTADGQSPLPAAPQTSPTSTGVQGPTSADGQSPSPAVPPTSAHAAISTDNPQSPSPAVPPTSADAAIGTDDPQPSSADSNTQTDDDSGDILYVSKGDKERLIKANKKTIKDLEDALKDANDSLSKAKALKVADKSKSGFMSNMFNGPPAGTNIKQHTIGLILPANTEFYNLPPSGINANTYFANLFGQTIQSPLSIVAGPAQNPPLQSVEVQTDSDHSVNQ